MLQASFLTATSARQELARLKEKAKELMMLGDLKAYFKTLLEVQQLEQYLYSFKLN